MVAKSEYLMLAHVYDSSKHRIGGWWVSEKLDGTRAFWDGGISRGLPVEIIPYANKIKDARYQEEQIATGLWTRSGKAIQAPSWWLDAMPKTMLDGELWIGYGQFQTLRTIVSSLVPTDQWKQVKFMAFDIPPIEAMFKKRDIKIRNDYTFPVTKEAEEWTWFHGAHSVSADWSFWIRYKALVLRCSGVACPVIHHQLPGPLAKAEESLKSLMDDILAAGGEGVMLRNGSSAWLPERCWSLLKHKPWFTAEGKVIGYISGKEGKTGPLLGLLGALVLDYNGKILKLSGLTHEQREIEELKYRQHAICYPGDALPFDYSHHLFPLGSTVEFKYRELSDDGIPKEARFWRLIDV